MVFHILGRCGGRVPCPNSLHSLQGKALRDAKCTTEDTKKCTVNLNEYGINLPDGKWAVDPDKNKVCALFIYMRSG